MEAQCSHTVLVPGKTSSCGKTYPLTARMRAAVADSPFTETTPASLGRGKNGLPARMSRSVLFPAPLGPMIANKSPRRAPTPASTPTPARLPPGPLPESLARARPLDRAQGSLAAARSLARSLARRRAAAAAPESATAPPGTPGGGPAAARPGDAGDAVQNLPPAAASRRGDTTRSHASVAGRARARRTKPRARAEDPRRRRHPPVLRPSSRALLRRERPGPRVRRSPGDALGIRIRAAGTATATETATRVSASSLRGPRASPTPNALATLLPLLAEEHVDASGDTAWNGRSWPDRVVLVDVVKQPVVNRDLRGARRGRSAPPPSRGTTRREATRTSAVELVLEVVQNASRPGAAAPAERPPPRSTSNSGESRRRSSSSRRSARRDANAPKNPNVRDRTAFGAARWFSFSHNDFDGGARALVVAPRLFVRPTNPRTRATVPARRQLERDV